MRKPEFVAITLLDFEKKSADLIININLELAEGDIIKILHLSRTSGRYFSHKAKLNKCCNKL